MYSFGYIKIQWKTICVLEQTKKYNHFILSILMFVGNEHNIYSVAKQVFILSFQELLSIHLVYLLKYK